MARLNEPPVSTDNPEILRRKLLRQNRDLARANSTHLARIRTLEAEKAQLLSEKLELNGRVIELEKEVENNGTSRIADHALDIRNRLESQLLECVSILGHLGQEPPRKRHAASPPSGKVSRPRMSVPHRSPPRKRPPESARDAEIRALSEGRLPPISENKSYPRRTMEYESTPIRKHQSSADVYISRNEILALCSEAADADISGSPELGPPPMSRFVDADTDPAKLASPSKPPPPPKQGKGQPSLSKPASLAASKPSNVTAMVEKTLHVKPDVPVQSKPPLAEEKSDEVIKSKDAPRSSSKRKYGTNDAPENETPMTTSDPSKSRPISTIRSNRTTSKSLKELANLRREAKERISTEPRKALSIKSANESPKKQTTVAKPSIEKDAEKPVKPTEGVVRKEKVKSKVNSEPKEGKADIQVPIVPQRPIPETPVVDVLPTTEPIPADTVHENEPAPLSPGSPELAHTEGTVHDTPPPADISSNGETTRPSRRARAAVSYAEPNLRDKMRRPSKQLFDAVTGEGRHRSRTSSSHSEEPPSVDSVSVKRESDADDSWKRLPAVIPTTNEALESAGAASPLAQKNPAKTTAERKKRTSTAKSPKDTPEDHDSPSSLEDATREQEVAEPADDPYEFPSSTPASITNGSKNGAEKKAGRRQSKSSRRLSSVAREDFLFDDTEEDPGKPSKSTSGRKRASMVYSPSEVSETGDHGSDASRSTQEESFPRARGRRRSMMI